MGNDLSSSNNDLLKKLNQTIMQDSWLEGVYGQQRTDQQSELKKVFTVISDNDVSASEKKALEKRAETLQDKVERLEAKMAVLEEQLAENADEVEKQADAITDLVCSIEDKSEEMEDQQKKYVKMAIEDVFYEYQKGIVDRDGIMPEIRKRIQDSAYKDKMSSQIEKLLSKLDAKQAEIEPLANATAKLLDQRNLLESQYGSTKSTYEFLNKTITQIGATETNYTNSDFNNAIPVYSLEKTEIVSELFEDPNLNVQAGENTNYVEGTSTPTTANITEKYKQYLGVATTGEAYSSSNNAVKALNNAINAGLLTDLSSSGLSGNQIAEFFATNFSGAKISVTDGKINIPYGHDESARTTYAKLSNFFANYGSSFKGALNTWDKEGGNTIDSNNQIKALSQNYTEVLEKMGTQEPKFTFKEAMYALFNQDTGLFKDSGVYYDATSQENNPNYFIELAGDDETAQMYSSLADKIYDIWGIRPTVGVDYDQYDAETGEGGTINDGDTTSTVKRTDPLSFIDEDGKEYSFIIDRNDDGAFSGADEFVGATGNWLEDLKSLDADGDGKLTGAELKNLKAISTDYTDNAETTYAGGKYLREETTRVDYGITNAAKMGVEEINLNDLEDNVNKSTGNYDINGSEIFNDSFTFTMNGKEVTASRKDDTNMFMDAIYGDAYGKNFQIGVNEGGADEIISKNYGEFDQMTSKYADVFADINVLQNASQLARDSRELYNKALNRTEADEAAQLMRASNKAASYSNANDWSTVSSQIKTLAAQQGIVIDMEQAKGIYVADSSMDARSVIEKYQEMVSTENDIAAERNSSKNVWSAVIKCAQNGIDATTDEISELIVKQGKSVDEAIAILSEQKGTDPNAEPLQFDSEREEEIYEAFNKVFNEAGLEDKAVEALYDLCVAQQNNRSYMEGKTAEQLAQELLKKYQ